MDYVLSLIRVLDHLQWESCYYIGHSLGGQLGLYLCSLWPQRVRKLVLLDTVGPLYTRTDSYLSYNRLLLDNILRTEKQFSNKKKPVYTYQEAVDRIMTGRYSELTEEAAKIVIRRSLMKSSDEGFRFTSDQRLKMRLASLLNEEQQLQILNGVKCPTLALLTSTPKIIARYPRFMTKHLELFTSKQNFQRIDVKGNHDVHINNPEIVAPYIVRFLTKQRCGL